ncbi:MAG TPA: ATP-binding protein [Micromonosporaceae bacterium]|jgi:signal transduction histidine kinase
MRGALRRLGPATLRGRITLAYATGVVLVVAAATLLAYLFIAAQVRSAVAEDLAVRLRDLRSAPAGDIAVDPYAQLLRGGRVLARSTAAPDGPVLDAAELARALTGEVVVTDVPGLRGDAMLAAERRPDGDLLVVGASLAATQRAIDQVLVGLLTAGLVLATASVLAVYRLVNAALRPVASLTREAAQITVEAADRRLPEPAGDDEIGALAHTLNQMLDRLDAAYRRERAFVDDAAHELRTPVAALRAELELGIAGDRDEARRALRAALVEADRLGRLATDLLVLARARAGELQADREPTDVTLRVRTWSRRIGEVTGLDVRVTGEEIVASVDVVGLEQIVSNLLGNAAQAGAHTVEVRVGAGPAGGATIIVDDDGPGFAEEILPVAFDRFSRAATARTRADGTGAGLGLAIVAEIARAHGGRAAVSNRSILGGARVDVVLPG